MGRVNQQFFIIVKTQSPLYERRKNNSGWQLNDVANGNQTTQNRLLRLSCNSNFRGEEKEEAKPSIEPKNCRAGVFN